MNILIAFNLVNNCVLVFQYSIYGIAISFPFICQLLAEGMWIINFFVDYQIIQHTKFLICEWYSISGISKNMFKGHLLL